MKIFDIKWYDLWAMFGLGLLLSGDYIDTSGLARHHVMNSFVVTISDWFGSVPFEIHR
jgi:hypothetical protein